VKGNTQAWPAAGPPVVTHPELGAAVDVVVVVVVEQMLLLQTGSPALLQTQVLQSMLNTDPGVQPPDPPDPPEDPDAPGQVLGQNPRDPSICSPAAVTLVLHQG